MKNRIVREMSVSITKGDEIVIWRFDKKGNTNQSYKEMMRYLSEEHVSASSEEIDKTAIYPN